MFKTDDFPSLTPPPLQEQKITIEHKETIYYSSVLQMEPKSQQDHRIFPYETKNMKETKHVQENNVFFDPYRHSRSPTLQDFLVTGRSNKKQHKSAKKIPNTSTQKQPTMHVKNMVTILKYLK